MLALLAVHWLWSAGAPTAAGQAGWPTVELTLVVDGFTRPLHLVDAGDGSGRLFVVEQNGLVKIVRNGHVEPTPFLDISDRVNADCSECGLLSIAFPPDFAEKRYFLASYTAKENLAPSPFPGSEPDGANDNVVARIRLTNNDDLADAASEERLLLVNQPYANHNGGLIAFGLDGLLYVGIGDGGRGGDPLNAGQRGDTLLGKLLRIEVGSTGLYTIPTTNPFVGSPTIRPEIWASGLRNPWRFSFDREMGDLYIADVGQDLYEEVNFQPANSLGGENYGWRIAEGAHCYGAENCDLNGLTPPIWEYGHDVGGSVTGGFIYRGAAPALKGIYLAGDFSSGRIWGLRKENQTWASKELLDSDAQIASFGQDAAGELYVVDYGGALYRIVDVTFEPSFYIHLPIVNRP